MAVQWVKLTELGDRKCDSVRFDWDDVIGKENGGYNYVFTRTLGEIDPADNDGGFRFDITACNVVDFNLNGGVDVNYGYYNEGTQELEIYDDGRRFQGEYNGKEYYIITNPTSRLTRWTWTEPLYYYGIHHIGPGSFDEEPIAAEDIYVRVYEEVEPEEPEIPTNPTIMDNVNRIEQAKSDIKDAIRNKGVYVDDFDRIDTYASKIYEISQEGGGNLGELYASVDKYSGTGYWDAMYDETYDGYRIVSINADEYGQESYRVGVEDTWSGITNFADGTTQENPWITPQVINYVIRYMSEKPSMSVSEYYFVKGTVMSIERIASSTANFTIGYTLGGNSTYNVTVNGCKYIDGATPFPEDGIKVGDNVVIKARIKTSNYEPILSAGTLISVETPSEGGGYDNPLSYGLKFANSDYSSVPEWAVLPADITRIDFMFNFCQQINDISQLANWDVSNVISIGSMFYNCPKLTDLTPIANWNTSNVMTMSYLFANCTKLTDITPLNNWDVSNVIAINSPFTDTLITKGPIWDTSNWKKLQLFDGANKLIEIPKYDARSLTSKPMLFGFRFSDLTTLTTFGGLDNLKMSWDDTYSLCKCPNLTYESCINVLNGLYDFTGNGETPDSNQGILKVHQNFLDLVGDEITIGTNKGWTITV